MILCTFKQQLKAYLFYIWMCRWTKGISTTAQRCCDVFYDSNTGYKTADLLTYDASSPQKDWFWAASIASSCLMSKKVRSLVIFLSQVEHGRSRCLLQNFVGSSKNISLASASPSLQARAAFPNSEWRPKLTVQEGGSCAVKQPSQSGIILTIQTFLLNS